MAMRDASRAAFIIIPEAVGALEIPLEKELAIDIWRTSKKTLNTPKLCFLVFFQVF
jgi:hypothetical protein